MTVALLGWVAASRADYIDHHFDAAPFTNGATFTVPVSQWQASDASVSVVSTKSVSGSQSVLVSDGTALSNAVAMPGPGVVWTEVRVAPVLGEAPSTAVTNGVATLQYFGTNGYLNVWTGGGWQACSNDVWDQPVVQVTNGVFAAVSIYQNFATRKAAILLNDQVVAQDLAFLGNSADFGGFRISGADSNAWLDDVYIQATYDSARHVANGNGVDGTDAAELQAYGYVARTLYVGVGQPYTSLSNALAVARDRDTLSVDCSALYSESVTITQNLTITGCAFTNSGLIAVAAGKTVTVATAFYSSLSVSGVLALAQGVVVSGATVSVVGSVTVATNNAQLLTGSLAISGSGAVASSGGRVTTPGVDLTGTFTLDHTWATAAAMGLPFSDDFELYAADSQVANLGFRGWGASSSGVVVKASEGFGGTKGVVVPDDSVLSNRIAGVGQPKIWTDVYLRPVLGPAPGAVDTNAYTFISFVGTDGFLNVWNSGAWATCSNYVDGSAATAMDTGTYARITWFLNFGTHRAAAFVGGKLVCEQVPFPAGAAIPSYGGFRAQSLEGSAALDNVGITTNIPAGLLAWDLDNDGIPDATEIHKYDALLAMPVGTVFKFR
jgi:hypothetical protein